MLLALLSGEPSSPAARQAQPAQSSFVGPRKRRQKEEKSWIGSPCCLPSSINNQKTFELLIGFRAGKEKEWNQFINSIH